MDKKPVSDLMNYAHDGVKFYKAVMMRLAKCHHSLNALCTESGISFSTTFRWKKGSKPEMDTILKLEQVFRKWEHNDLLQGQHTEGALVSG